MLSTLYSGHFAAQDRILLHSFLLGWEFSECGKHFLNLGMKSERSQTGSMKMLLNVEQFLRLKFNVIINFTFKNTKRLMLTLKM